MLVVQCPSCDHINPADANLCRGCRLPLPEVSWQLAPCPRCGALNGITATPCWSCNADLEIQTPAIASSQLADRDGDAAPPLGLASEISAASAPSVGAKTFRRQRFGLIIGSLVVATLAFSGYWAYRERSIPDSPRPAPAAVAPIHKDLAAADDSKERQAGKRVDPGIATSPSQLRSAAAAAATANKSVDQDGVKRPEAASAVPAAVKRQKTTNAAVRAERRQPPIGPCTEAIAALGLCTPEPMRLDQ